MNDIRRNVAHPIICAGDKSSADWLLGHLKFGSTKNSKGGQIFLNGDGQKIGLDAFQFICFVDHSNSIDLDLMACESFFKRIITCDFRSDAAIVILDARYGVITESRRRSILLSLIGIRNVIVVVNYMDAVDYSETVFDRFCDEYRELASRLEFEEMTFVPVSTINGDNITTASECTPWYKGYTLSYLLETLEMDELTLQTQSFRLPIESIQCSDLVSSVSGCIATGTINIGDSIRVQPSGQSSSVESISIDGNDLTEAIEGQAVTLMLADKIRLPHGGLIYSLEQPAQTANQFQTNLVWFDCKPMLPGRHYLMKIASQEVDATITDIRYQIDVDTLAHVPVKKLELNNIAVCNVNLPRPIAFDPYQQNPKTGGFVLVDHKSKKTVAVGMINFALRRSQNIHMQHVDINKAARSTLKAHKPCLLWMTGLSGSGKSTIANLVEKKLYAMGVHTYLLDGDNVRHGLNKDLGFTDGDRVENIRRVAEVGKLMVDAGLVVISAFISPFSSERAMARGMLDEGEFLEVFIDTSLEVAESRDPKGLYKKARRGELKNFTGIDSAYEKPESPEVCVNTSDLSAEEAADKVISVLLESGKIEI